MLLRLSLTLPVLFSLVAGAQLDASTFSLQQSRYNPAIAKLDAALSSTRLSTLLDSAQYDVDPASEEMETTPWYRKGFMWSSDDWHDDADTTSWRPKGVSTLADTDLEVFEGNSEVLAVMWMDVRNITGKSLVPGQGARVTFVRKGSADVGVRNKAYSHVLLVEPFIDDNGEGSFRVLDGIETGGMVWRGRWIYITDKHLGVRVFDVESMFNVPKGTHIGRNSAGKYAASQYTLVMPQAYTYTPLSFTLDKLAPTVLSLDRNSTTTPRLLIGENAPLSVAYSNFAAFPFDAKTGLLSTNSTRAVTATWAWRTNVHACVGMVYSPAAKLYFIIQSFGDDVRGNILRWIPGSHSDEYDETLPPGPEGGAIRPGTEELWVAGGLPGHRYVMALSTSLTNSTITPSDSSSDEAEPTTAAAADTPKEESEPAENPPLAPAVIAGISVGAGAFVILLAVTVFLFLRLRRRKEQPYGGKPELSGKEVARDSYSPSGGEVFEKEAKSLYEMGTDQTFELPGEQKGLPELPNGSAVGGLSIPAPASRAASRSPSRGRTETRPPPLKAPERQEERRWEELKDNESDVREIVERAGLRPAQRVRRKSTEELVSPLTPSGWM